MAMHALVALFGTKRFETTDFARINPGRGLARSVTLVGCAFCMRWSIFLLSRCFCNVNLLCVKRSIIALFAERPLMKESMWCSWISTCFRIWLAERFYTKRICSSSVLSPSLLKSIMSVLFANKRHASVANSIWSDRS